MKFAVVAEIAAVAIAGVLVFSTLAANAQPSSRDCWAMVDKAKAAGAANAGASQEARDHYQAGQEACTKGYTTLGVAQLQAAINALGSQSAQR